MASQTSREFAETAVLLAKLENDEDRVYELLADMLPGELQKLADALTELAADANFVASKKGRGL